MKPRVSLARCLTAVSRHGVLRSRSEQLALQFASSVGAHVPMWTLPVASYYHQQFFSKPGADRLSIALALKRGPQYHHRRRAQLEEELKQARLRDMAVDNEELRQWHEVALRCRSRRRTRSPVCLPTLYSDHTQSLEQLLGLKAVLRHATWSSCAAMVEGLSKIKHSIRLSFEEGTTTCGAPFTFPLSALNILITLHFIVINNSHRLGGHMSVPCHPASHHGIGACRPSTTDVLGTLGCRRPLIVTDQSDGQAVEAF